MPLHNKRPFQPALNPPARPSDEVFQLWPTGEIFPDYETYIAALWHQRSPHWTCAVTGKSNLTLPAALESEQVALQSLQELPEPWKKVAARTIHHSLHALNHAAGLVYERAKADEYLEGEEVSVMLGGERVFGRIVKIMPSLDAGAEQIKLALYRDGELREWMGEGTVIGTMCLQRVGRLKTITKNIIKRYMRSIARRDNPFAPWQVDCKVAGQFGLPVEIPYGLLQGRSTADKPSTKKRHKPNDDAEDQPQPLVYPIEDLLIPPESFIQLDETLGTPLNEEYDVPGDIFLDCLVIWSFLTSFSKFIGLSPFSFDDWIDALQADSPSMLLEEAIYVLFEPLCKLRRTLSRADFAKYLSMHPRGYPVDQSMKDKKTTLSVVIPSAKKHCKWYETNGQKGFVSCFLGFAEEACILAEEHSFGSENWHSLMDSLKSVKKGSLPAVENTISLLGFLLDAYIAGHSSQLRDIVDAEIERAEGLREKLRDLFAEEQSVQAEIVDWEQKLVAEDGPDVFPADSKERRKAESSLRRAKQDASQLAKKRETAERDIRKASWTHRSGRLGLDRHHRSYWWLDGWRAVGSAAHACGKLFIEDPSTGKWTFIDSEEELDRLIAGLNEKGVRESKLRRSLVELRDHMSACFIPATRKQKEEEEAEQKRRGGVRRQEPTYLKYKNKL